MKFLWRVCDWQQMSRFAGYPDLDADRLHELIKVILPLRCRGNAELYGLPGVCCIRMFLVSNIAVVVVIIRRTQSDRLKDVGRR